MQESKKGRKVELQESRHVGKQKCRKVEMWESRKVKK